MEEKESLHITSDKWLRHLTVLSNCETTREKPLGILL